MKSSDPIGIASRCMEGVATGDLWLFSLSIRNLRFSDVVLSND